MTKPRYQLFRRVLIIGNHEHDRNYPTGIFCQTDNDLSILANDLDVPGCASFYVVDSQRKEVDLVLVSLGSWRYREG